MIDVMTLTKPCFPIPQSCFFPPSHLPIFSHSIPSHFHLPVLPLSGVSVAFPFKVRRSMPVRHWRIRRSSFFSKLSILLIFYLPSPYAPYPMRYALCPLQRVLCPLIHLFNFRIPHSDFPIPSHPILFQYFLLVSFLKTLHFQYFFSTFGRLFPRPQIYMVDLIPFYQGNENLRVQIATILGTPSGERARACNPASRFLLPL
jgi:hypothetical protein